VDRVIAANEALALEKGKLETAEAELVKKMKEKDRAATFRSDELRLTREIARVAEERRASEHRLDHLRGQLMVAQGDLAKMQGAYHSLLDEVNSRERLLTDLKEEIRVALADIGSMDDALVDSTAESMRLKRVEIDDRNGFEKFFSFSTPRKATMTTEELNAAKASLAKRIKSIKTKHATATSHHRRATERFDAAFSSVSKASQVEGLRGKFEASKTRFLAAKKAEAEALAVVSDKGAEIEMYNSQVAEARRLYGNLKELEEAVLLASTTRDAAKESVKAAALTHGGLVTRVKEVTDRVTAKRTPDTVVALLMANSPLIS